MRSLAYVRLQENNGGIIRDLTDSGVALQAVSPLQTGEKVAVRFELFSPRVRVETSARVAWADQNGQAGLQFTDMSARSKRGLRDWMLIQMLNAAAASGRDSIFVPLDAQLVVSAAARPPIALPLDREQQRVEWGLLSCSAQTFSFFVDCLVLLCAILLFSICAIVVMGGIPALPLAAALLFAASAILVAAYQLIFSEFLCGASPGKRLAREASGSRISEQFVTRFR